MKPKINGAMKLARLVMYRAPTDEGPWQPVDAQEVPEWIKNDPTVVRRLKDGYMAHNPDNTDKHWYRAEEAVAAGPGPTDSVILQP